MGPVPLQETCPPGYLVNAGECELAPSSCGPSTQELPCNVPPIDHCCGSSCVDLLFDRNNCGVCGHACAPGQLCELGACQAAATTCTFATQGAKCMLPAGGAGTCCGDACVDETADSSNCGHCGTSCEPPASCVAGQCAVPGGSVAQCNDSSQPHYFACPAGTSCSQLSTGYSCLTSGCTAAGEFACPSTLVGNNIMPSFNSDGPSMCCSAGDGGCRDFTSDPNNCGGCGFVCPSGVCFEGNCYPGVAGADCASEGGCPAGTVCASGYCVAGPCNFGSGPWCAAPDGALGLCCLVTENSGTCVDPMNDPSNCGGCGIACASCTNGKCSP
jgi:hypothetical protein